MERRVKESLSRQCPTTPEGTDDLIAVMAKIVGDAELGCLIKATLATPCVVVHRIFQLFRVGTVQLFSGLSIYPSLVEFLRALGMPQTSLPGVLSS